MKYVVMFSGGAASYEAGRRTIERVGRANVVLLFSDTLIEDPDLYRFLDQTTELLESLSRALLTDERRGKCFATSVSLATAGLTPARRS